MEIIDISHVWCFTTTRRSAFGGRLAAETEKEGVGNRMLCASEVKNKAAKKRENSPLSHVQNMGKAGRTS